MGMFGKLFSIFKPREDPQAVKVPPIEPWPPAPSPGVPYNHLEVLGSPVLSPLIPSLTDLSVAPMVGVPKRVDLVYATGLQSSYVSTKTGKRFDVSALKGSARVCPDMFDALLKLDKLIQENKGNLYVTDLFREWAVQAKLRQEYEASIADPNIKDKAFAALPGGSFHQAGRAIDLDVKNLNFEGVPKDQQLDKLWSLAKPLGFKPIIRIPDEGMSECWHFDFPGKDWDEVYSKLNYGEAAKCAILDVGNWNPTENEETLRKLFVQAQLIRLGFYEIGKVDGVIGVKTKKVLTDMGIANLDTSVQAAILAKQKR